MNLFGKAKPKQKAPEIGDAIQRLRQASDNLDKRAIYIETQIDDCVAKARAKLQGGDKRGAKHILNKKAMLTKQLDGIDGKKMTLMNQIMVMEEAAGNQDMVDAMKYGNAAMKNIMEKTDADSMAEQMEQIAETMDYATEINDILVQGTGNDLVDQDEVDDELNAMMDDIENEKALEAEQQLDALAGPPVFVPTKTVASPKNQTTTTTTTTPTPTPTPAAPESHENKELDDLAAMMGM